MKSQRVQVTSLARDLPKEILSVPWEDTEPVSSEATVYAGLQSRVTGVGGVVAVSLVAGLLGHRQVVGTVGIPPGFDGLAVIASGIVADAWHVEAYGGGSDIKLSVALGIRQCCSGFGVFVPPELQTDIPIANTKPFSARVLPLGREHGAYRMVSGSGGGSVGMGRGERMLRMVVTGDDPSATVTGIPEQNLWIILNGETREIQPRGNLQGPRTIVITNSTYHLIELVR